MNQNPDPHWRDDTQWGGQSQWNSPPTSEFRPIPPGGYAPPPPKQGMSAGLAVALTLMAVVIVGLIAAVGFLVVPGLTGSSAAPTTSTVVATATAAPSAAASEPSQEQVQPARPAQASAPAGSYQCSDSGGGALSRSAVGSSVTSCEFAISVRSTYLSQGGSGESRVVRAYSPVTGRTYTMSCSGGDVVTCTGGNNAVVYIY